MVKWAQFDRPLKQTRLQFVEIIIVWWLFAYRDILRYSMIYRNTRGAFNLGTNLVEMLSLLLTANEIFKLKIQSFLWARILSGRVTSNKFSCLTGIRPVRNRTHQFEISRAISSNITKTDDFNV